MPDSVVPLPPRNRPANPKLWCFTTYFAEGLPFGIIRSMSSVFFTDIGVKNQYIGFLNFLGIPWNFKFLWAPLIDIIGTKRAWMISLQAIITLFTLLIAGVCWIIPTAQAAVPFLIAIGTLFVVLAFLSATNDIAIDGHFIEGLPHRNDQAGYTGYRVLAWRLSFIFVRFGLVGLASAAAKFLAGSGPYKPWAVAFAAGALVMMTMTVLNLFSLPRIERPASIAGRSFKSHLIEFVKAFPSWLTQEKIGLVIVFIIFYKIGDEILFSMGTPFLMRELLVTKGQIAWLSGLAGTAGSIAGTWLGGWWIKKTGLKKAIWPLTILMNINIWAYIWLAWAHPVAATPTGLWTIAIVHCYEQWAAGLGNAVLIVFILRTCKPDYKAAHYAIGSAIMSLPSTFIGGFGGVIVEAIGYLNLFILSFCASIPSMLLLFWVPIQEEAPKKLAET
jgi:PAT family beta-lactamase induction signal transducer AmpG